MNNKLPVLFIAILTLTANTALADWTFGGYLESISLDPEKAAQEGIEDSAWALGFNADYFSDQLMMVSLGSALVFYDDNREFNQQVEVVGGFDDGDIRTESSEALGMSVHADFGPRFAFGASDSSFFSAKAGFTGFLFSERSIGYCDNCYEEDIDIDGGVYVQTALGHSFGAVSLGLVYNQYLDDGKGISDSFRFLIATGF